LIERAAPDWEGDRIVAEFVNNFLPSADEEYKQEMKGKITKREKPVSFEIAEAAQPR